MNDPFGPTSRMEDSVRSAGAAGIVDALSQLTRTPRAPVWDVVLINLATLIRNALGKDVSDQTVVESVFDDTDNIVRAIRRYFDSFPVPPEKPGVILYLPSYTKLPDLHRRTPNTQTLRIQKIQNTLQNKYLKDPKIPEVINVADMTCVTMCVGNKFLYPHMELYEYIRKQATAGIFGTIKSALGFINFRIGMVSHHAIDFHIAKNVKNFSLLSSYTGEIKTLDQLGKKVFKLDGIPFNTATHLLFGDSTHVKPIAMRKTKQIIVDVATRGRWMTKSETSIINEAVATGQIPREFLTTVKF